MSSISGDKSTLYTRLQSTGLFLVFFSISAFLAFFFRGEELKREERLRIQIEMNRRLNEFRHRNYVDQRNLLIEESAQQAQQEQLRNVGFINAKKKISVLESDAKRHFQTAKALLKKTDSESLYNYCLEIEKAYGYVQAIRDLVRIHGINVNTNLHSDIEKYYDYSQDSC